MYLKQEKPEMDDFEEKKNLVLNEKYFKENILRKYFETDTIAKHFNKYFCIFLCFRIL